jgi:hypothetical protein
LFKTVESGDTGGRKNLMVPAVSLLRLALRSATSQTDRM